jgi:hypothetical protein
MRRIRFTLRTKPAKKVKISANRIASVEQVTATLPSQ